MPDDEGNYSALEIVADYECPECGPVVDPDNPTLTEDEASAILGGDANGFLRCPNDWCDEEIELTAEAALGMLAMVAERMPELGPEIAARIAEGLS